MINGYRVERQSCHTRTLGPSLFRVWLCQALFLVRLFGSQAHTCSRIGQHMRARPVGARREASTPARACTAASSYTTSLATTICTSKHDLNHSKLQKIVNEIVIVLINIIDTVIDVIDTVIANTDVLNYFHFLITALRYVCVNACLCSWAMCCLGTLMRDKVIKGTSFVNRKQSIKTW